MYEVFIGIDVSKDVLDYASLFNNELQYFGKYKNTIAEIKKAIGKLAEKVESADFSSWIFCFENTGVYSKPLLRVLHELGIACVEEDAKTIHSYFSQARGKTDEWDAVRICQYVFDRHDKLSLTEQSDQHIDQLKHFHNYRSKLVETKRSLQNTMSEKIEFEDAEVLGATRMINANMIANLEASISKVEEQIQFIICSDKEIEKNYKLVTSVIGIGPVIGVAVIIFTNNFRSIIDPRKFAAYIGIAPFPNQSGKRKGRNRVNRRANIALKALLSNGVLPAINHDPQIRQYKMRLTELGKPDGVIYNNIKNKLIQRIFSVVKRGTPYVKLAY